jgi:hypothetical protein
MIRDDSSPRLHHWLTAAILLFVTGLVVPVVAGLI